MCITVGGCVGFCAYVCVTLCVNEMIDSVCVCVCVCVWMGGGMEVSAKNFSFQLTGNSSLVYSPWALCFWSFYSQSKIVPYKV